MKLTPAKTRNPDPAQATLGFGGPDALPSSSPSSDSRAETLMPYEKAAKAIYVRANGLPAYRRATGHIRRSADTGDCEPTQAHATHRVLEPWSAISVNCRTSPSVSTCEATGSEAAPQENTK